MFYSKPSGKGERLIVLHAGGKEGSVNKLCCQYEDIFELTGCD